MKITGTVLSAESAMQPNNNSYSAQNIGGNKDYSVV
jgi:hypothetical protein